MQRTYCISKSSEKCPHCGSKNLKQDEDVLDTWASSWLWAYDVFETEEEQNYYYPTDTTCNCAGYNFLLGCKNDNGRTSF